MQKNRKRFLSQCILHMELCSTNILFSWVGKGRKYWSLFDFSSVVNLRYFHQFTNSTLY